MENTSSVNAGKGTADPIIPIDFTPNNEKAARFSYRFKWSHPVLGIFIFLSISAAWFVLTARSVFVEVEPLPSASQKPLARTA